MSLRFPFCLVILGIALCLNTSTWAQSSEPEAPEPTGILRLSDAIEAAVLGNPSLAVYPWDIRIADARIIQAGLRPNPELLLEVENIALGGSSGSSGTSRSLGIGADGSPTFGFERERTSESRSVFGQSEITLRLSQIIELGGKRSARIEAAQRGKDVASWDYEVARYRVIGEVVVAFADVLAAQEEVEQFGQLVELGERLTSTVEDLVEAGESSPLEGRRARSAVESLRIEQRRREQAVHQAKIRLAAMWGSSEPAFEAVEGNVASMPELPAVEVLLEKKQAHPLLRQWEYELARRKAVLQLEERRAIPDLEMTFGYRAEGLGDETSRSFGLGSEGLSLSRGRGDSDDDWDHSLTVEFSIPLPIFNRNQGARKEAEYQVQKAAYERRASEKSLDARVAEFHAAASGAREAAESLRVSVIPEMQETFELTQVGYRSGKFDFVTVLDAERQLVDARLRATEAEIAYHTAVAAMEQTLGAGIFNNDSVWDVMSDPAATIDHDERAISPTVEEK